jgi:SMC interacting uncharacterized protein involved in chromosome segregation
MRQSMGPRQLSLGGGGPLGVDQQPTTRRSSAVSRPSATGKRQDPRDVKDKVYIRNCKRRLISFLVENGYNRPITEQTVAAPTSKDFFHMFEFLYKMLNPNFVLSDKPNEQVAIIFAELKYPFQITKVGFYLLYTTLLNPKKCFTT